MAKRPAKPSTASARPAFWPVLDVAEWLTSVLLTLVVIGLILFRAGHSGAVWRDECSSIQLATQHNWPEIWDKFTFEAFPLLFPATVRLHALLFGTSPAAWVAYGVIISLLLVAALWGTAWLLQRSPPLLSLALLGLNTTMLIWGGTVRGYGLASVLIVATFGLIAQVRRRPVWPWILPATLSALASVHAALHNSFLLLILCGAAALVSLVRKEFRSAVVVLLIGAVCALTILPYVPRYAGADWKQIVEFDIRFDMILSSAVAALSAPSDGAKLFWGWLFLAAAGGGAWRLWKGRGEPMNDLLAYGWLVLLLAPAFYLRFLLFLSYFVPVWYFLILMSVCAAAMELVLARTWSGSWFRWTRLAVVLLMICSLAPAATKQLTVQRTNLHIAARELANQAQPGDLIIIDPWPIGISFQWHYRGPVRWVTLPMISDHTVHRYDLVREKMMSSAPLEDLLAEIRSTLQSGHRVWLAGQPDRVPSDQVLQLPPAPDGPHGWMSGPYEAAWSQQTVAFLDRHSTENGDVPLPTDQLLPFEHCWLWRFSGWRE